MGPNRPDPGRADHLTRIAARRDGFSVTEAEMATWEMLYHAPGPEKLIQNRR